MLLEISKEAVIEALGERVTIRNILFQQISVNNDRDIENMADVEFIDTNGKYRHWQSWNDGGTLIVDGKRHKFKREV